MSQIDVKAEWEKARRKGAMLSLGLTKNEDEACNFIKPIRSQWDGDLIAEMKTWGYREVTSYGVSPCAFDASHHDLEHAFAEMVIDPRSSDDGGPNICYKVEHQNGPTIEKGSGGKDSLPWDQWYIADGRRLRVRSQLSQCFSFAEWSYI